MALTLTEALLITDLRQYIGDNSDTFADRKLHRACITGLERLGRHRCWSFHRDSFPVNTVVAYKSTTASGTPTAAVAIGATAVTTSAGALPSGIVTNRGWIEFDGQRRAYEITVRGGDTSLTIRTAYGNSDATDLTAATYVISYPSIALPANFKSLRKVIDSGRSSILDIIQSDDMEELHASRSGVGSPDYCAVRPLRNDPNTSLLWLYPAPDTQETYEILYNRTPGWYDTSTIATASFALEPTTTAYYVDWPLHLKGLLLASCRLSLVEEGIKGIDYGAALQSYRELLMAAESDDERAPEFDYLGRDSMHERLGETWRIGT